MGATVPYRVRVLRTVEEVIEVSAVTSYEAMEEAAKEPGVIHVVEVIFGPGYGDPA